MVYLHALSDLGGLTNDDARSMVDEERRADLRPWMDIDASKGMDSFGDDARYIWDLQLIESMGNPVIDDGLVAWVSIDNLKTGFASGITFIEEVEIGI